MLMKMLMKMLMYLDQNNFPCREEQGDDWTWEKESRCQVGPGGGWRVSSRIRLAKLRAVSSILSKSQSSPVIKMKSIISLKFSWEIFWKLSVKENDKTNVIFMPSFTHNRWSCDADWLHHTSRPRLTKHSPLSRWNQLRNILGAQRQSKWHGKCYLYAIIYQQPPVSWWSQLSWPVAWPKIISVTESVLLHKFWLMTPTGPNCALITIFSSCYHLDQSELPHSGNF